MIAVRGVVLVTLNTQKREVVVDREPVYWLIRNVTASMDGRGLDVNSLTVLGTLIVVTRVNVFC